VLGSAVGYVAGGVVGRITATAVSDLEHELARLPAADLLAGGVDEGAPAKAVDSRLLRLACDRGGVLVTNDSGLSKMAAALDVPVRSIHALADAMRAAGGCR
jgi:hypothetical protein